jgi:hypothetical protein
MTPMAQPPTSTNQWQGWAELGAALAGLGAALWGVARFLFRPFALWLFKRFGDEVYKKELARGEKSAAAVTTLQQDVEQLRGDMAQQAEHLEQIPDIKRDVALALASAERTETAVSKLTDVVTILAEKVGEARGAQGLHGPYTR